jgi:hypothetical protein
MTVNFLSGNTRYLLIVARESLQRREPVITADKNLWSSGQRKNIGMSEFDEQKEYAERQRQAARKRFER